MQVFILAGGLGTRLRPVVSDVPKGMALVRGKPFLQHQIEWLTAQGLTSIVLCLGYMHEAIEEYFGDGSRFGADIRYSVEAEPMGTAGALRLARPLFDGDAFVMNGDTFLDAELRALAECHRASAALASIGALHRADATRYGTLVFGPDGAVTAFVEKGARAAGWVNSGAYVVSPRAFEAFPERQPLSLEQDVFPLLAARGLLRACVLRGSFVDIGTPESYASVQTQEPGRE